MTLNGKAIAVLLLLLGWSLASAAGFEVRNAVSRLDGNVYFLNATIDYELSPQAIEAINSGVPLTFDLEIEVLRIRRWWFDAQIAPLKQSFELKFNALSKRYVLQNLNSGQQESYSTLYAALGAMGRIVELPVVDISLLDPGARYKIRIRAVLDQQRLPGPLQMLAFWSDGYRLESDWFSWTLNE